MKGVLDSMAVLKDCEAKTKLVDVVKDCFDHKEMALADEAELTATLDSMWIDIHSDSLGEIAKAFEKLGKKNEKPAEAGVADSEKEDEAKDSEDKEEENKDSEDKEDEAKDSDKEDEAKDSEDKEDKKEDGCNKDSNPMVATILDSLKSELKPLVTEAVKECLGIKETKTSVEGSELDSVNKDEGLSRFDYESFI